MIGAIPRHASPMSTRVARLETVIRYLIFCGLCVAAGAYAAYTLSPGPQSTKAVTCGIVIVGLAIVAGMVYGMTYYYKGPDK